MTTKMNLFGSIVPNLNTTFLIDTSGSMYSCLATVREHLSAYLRVHAVDVPNPHQTILFNLMEFNSDVRRWADRCVFWSHASVVVADDWLRSLVPKTGTNTLGGLITAFADSLCQQVVLVTDGIPDQEPPAILSFIQQQDKRPCHIFYINTPANTDTERENVVKFLQDLAALTRGSLTIAHFSRTGSLEDLAPMINYQMAALLIESCSTNAMPAPPIETAVSSEVGALLVGQECLARKDKDGYYYRGKILNQLNTHQFMVEFGPRSTGAFSESDFQPTYLFDIIHYADALLHNIKMGDFVLAPDTPQDRFVPGEVLDGFEKRASCEHADIRPLVIHFAHGKTVTLKRMQEAVWIPSALYERIKFELTLPPSARQFLQTHSAAYPNKLLPGYPNQQHCVSPMVLMPQQTAPASVNSYDVNNLIMPSPLKPQSLMTSDELNRRVDQQIKRHWLLLDERSPTMPSRCVSASCSPNPFTAAKKNVSFDHLSTVRRYSVDDLDTYRESTPLKSCLKSSTSQTMPSPVPCVPMSIEHWHGRQLKPAPSSTPPPPTGPGPRRQNLSHVYEKAQQEVKAELHQQQLQREQHKRQQFQEQSQRIQTRQQQEADKADRFIEAKKQFRGQITHQNHLRTQAVLGQDNARLRFKQDQRAQRSADQVQTRDASAQKNAELDQRRQQDLAARHHAHHETVLSQEFNRLYKETLDRKLHQQSTHKAQVLRDREEKRVDMTRDIERRRVAWSNSSSPFS